MQVAVNKYGLKIYNIFPLSFKVPTQIEKFTNAFALVEIALALALTFKLLWITDRVPVSEDFG